MAKPPSKADDAKSKTGMRNAKKGQVQNAGDRVADAARLEGFLAGLVANCFTGTLVLNPRVDSNAVNARALLAQAVIVALQNRDDKTQWGIVRARAIEFGKSLKVKKPSIQGVLATLVKSV